MLSAKLLDVDEIGVTSRSAFNREYFLVVAIKPEGNLGRGRYEMRKAELALAKEFTV